MKLRFTRPAARQLDRVLDYIAERSPQGALHVQQRIQTVMNLLLEHPQAGVTTSMPGLRRIVVAPFPYAISYRIGDHEIVISGIRHTARRPE